MKGLTLFLLLFSFFSCFSSGENSQTDSQKFDKELQNSIETNKTSENIVPEDDYIVVSDNLTREESLKFGEYTVKRVGKIVRPDDLPEAEIYDTVLEKNGKSLFKFEAMYYPLGNGVGFGLFNLLKKEKKQLIISDTIPRMGNHYVIDFTNEPKIIFDSTKFGLGNEDILIKDIDNDAVDELIMAKSLSVFNDLPNSAIPYTGIYFRYDEKSKKYLPANHLFAKYILENVETRRMEINHQKEPLYVLADVADIVLDYIFAGKEKEGWEFFDNEYKLEDAEAVKIKIKKELAVSPVYKFIKSDLKNRN